MFYYLLLAHLLADYPLQSTWMVNHKNRLEVVTLHAFIQFITGLILVWFLGSKVAAAIWPFLLVLAVLHFLIDLVKIALIRYRPTWVKVPYLVDQLVHILSILIISLYIQQRYGLAAFFANTDWVVVAIAYLLVTYVWYISEKVMTHDDPQYHEIVINDSMPRMFFRAVFLSVFLVIWVWPSKPLLGLTSASLLPYQKSQYGRRAFLTDLGVTLCVFMLLIFVKHS